MPVAVSSAVIHDIHVTDIRYREDVADLNKPEDLPASKILITFGNKSLSIMKKHFFLVLGLFLATLANAQLSGTYTINCDASQNPDYSSIGAAATILTEQGVSGPVIFEIAPGSYNESITLMEIEGSNETNRVIFRGMGADNQQVTLNYNAGSSDNATLTLNKTDYVTFENMTIVASSDQKARVVKMIGGNEHNRFQQVRFIGSVSTVDLDNAKDLVKRESGSWLDIDNAFIGCDFINGYIALYYQGHNIYQYNDGLVVENCTFSNQCSKSIYITFTDHVTVRGNLINNNHDIKSNYNAIDVFRTRYGCLFENNVMNVTRTSTNNYAEVFKLRPCTGTEEEPVIIRNNIVNLNSNADFSYCYVFDYDDSDHIYFAHNTAQCTGSGTCGNIYVNKSWPNLFIYNNLLVNNTPGYVFRFVSSNTSGRLCDYNRISFTGDYLARLYTSDYTTVADWNAATGFDAHSALCNPQFVSTNDLHITSNAGLTVGHPLSYVITDIDEEPRSAVPCAGADEYVSGTNLPPIVQNPVTNVVFEDYPASQTINLNNTFTDPDDPDEDIVIELTGNSNADLVSATLNNRLLTVQRLISTGGSSTITLRATSHGQSVETSFSVECLAEDLPPVIANPLSPIHFTEFPQSLNFDLTNTFDDPDNNNNLIEISVQSCPSEVTAMYNNFVLTLIRNTPAAFTNKVMVIRATSNGKQVDMEVPLSGDAVVIGPGIATFEEVTLNSDGVWQAPQEGDNTFISNGWNFTNYYSEYFWGGFTVSNHTDLTQSSLDAQYTAAAGEGHDGSAQYAVAYTMGAQTQVSTSDGSMHTVTGCYVTNNLWAYQNMLEGDYTATPFGGTTGDDPDWFKLTATGKNANGQTVGTLNFYLADYRFNNHENDYILNTWEWFDLSLLGPVASITFSLSSSKNNAYGMITPAYFCVDDFNGIGPETPNQPPVIANPVADVVFDLFPQSIEIDLNGVASDPDDDDEAIVYSLVSNSNTTALAAALTGKTLTLNRLVEEQTTAELSLRAFSNGQSVDFNIHVILNEVTDLPPVIANPVADVVFDLFPQSIEIDLNGVASDPDDDDEAIVYSLVSNSNTTALAADLTGKTLVLNRLANTDAVADLTIRATSDGQHVDFTIHIILNHYVNVDEREVIFEMFPNPCDGIITVRLPQYDQLTLGQTEYNIHNLTGQLVLFGYLDGETTILDLRSLQKGIYFISLNQAGAIHIDKIVIN